MRHYLFQVTLRNLCAGAVANQSGIVTHAAPILHFCVGGHIDRLRAWVREKRGMINLVSHEDT